MIETIIRAMDTGEESYFSMRSDIAEWIKTGDIPNTDIAFVVRDVRSRFQELGIPLSTIESAILRRVVLKGIDLLKSNWWPQFTHQFKEWKRSRGENREDWGRYISSSGNPFAPYSLPGEIFEQMCVRLYGIMPTYLKEEHLEYIRRYQFRDHLPAIRPGYKSILSTE